MIKKLAYLGAIALLISSIISCEKDFEDVSSNIIGNDKFNVKDTVFYITLDSLDIKKVQTDNINLNVKEMRYLLGGYKNANYKEVNTSLITQVSLPNFVSESGTSTVRVIDASFITFPYQTTNSEGSFTLNGIIGDEPENVSIKVYRNNTYLNTLNPTKPVLKNQYFSNQNFEKFDNINLVSSTSPFTLSNKATDTAYFFNRYLTNTTFEADTLELAKGIPFYTIPLNKNYIKTNLLDKIGSADLDNIDAFKDYFRGLIIEAERTSGTGSIVSFNLNSQIPSLYIYYSDVVYKDSKIDTILRHETVIPLNGIRASNYNMTDAENGLPTNGVAIQGGAGSGAKLNEILSAQQVQDLRIKNWLISDASLTLYADKTIETNSLLVPNRLLLYKEAIENNDTIATQVSDAYTESAFFGGYAEFDSNKKLEKYTIRITDYISNLLSPTSNDEVTPLRLKVYNPYTDNAIKNKTLDTIISTYSWTPNMVTILNGNISTNGDKRAQLKITYTEEK